MNIESMEFYHVDSMVSFQEIISLKNKGWAYVINIDKYSDVGTNWIIFHCKNDEIFYFDSFGVEHVPKGWAYVINIDKYSDVSTNWIVFYCKNDEILYFDSFGVEHVPKEKEKFIGHKNIKTNIFRVKSSNLIMFGYFCIGFIYFMFCR